MKAIHASSAIGALFLCSAQVLAQSAQRETPLIDEIIVTAQKREQRLQDVPVTVSVVSAGDLQHLNINDTIDLARAVPALQVVGGGSGAIQIRGIGTIGYSANSEPSVATVIDGVVMPRMAGSIFSAGGLFDIERVEVLSGPQGTLFGKNSSAGVINIVTRAPQFDATEAIGHFEYGEMNYGVAQATLNVPLGERTALRVGANYRGYEGVVRNTIRGESRDHSEGARVRLRWQPDAALRVDLLGDYQYSGGNGVRTIVGPIRRAGAGTQLAQHLAACGVTPGPENNVQCTEATSSASGFFTPVENFGASLQIDYGFGGYTLTSITADRTLRIGNLLPFNTPANDGDNTTLPIVTSNPLYSRSKNFSEEIRLTSPAGSLFEFVAGLYFSSFESRNVNNLVILNSSAQSDTRGDLSSRALFAQATLNATDNLRFILGGRYTDERLTEVTETGAEPGYTLLPAFSPHNITVRTDNFSWRLGVQYDLTDDITGFATVTRGYKGPQINTLPPSSIAPVVVNPEKPTNYEIGLKSSLFDNRIAANLTAFRQKVENFQTVVAIPSQSGNITVFSTGNAPYVQSKGVDLSVFGKVTRSLGITASALYNDASYSPNFIVPCVQGSPAGCLTTSVSSVIFVPKWKVRFSADFDRSLTSALDFFAGVDVNHTSRFYYSVTPDPFLKAPSYTIYGARFGVRSADERWGLYVFGRNLTDERVPEMVAADSSGTLNGGASQSYTHNLGINSYRVIGIAADLKF